MEEKRNRNEKRRSEAGTGSWVVSLVFFLKDEEGRRVVYHFSCLFPFLSPSLIIVFSHLPSFSRTPSHRHPHFHQLSPASSKLLQRRSRSFRPECNIRKKRTKEQRNTTDITHHATRITHHTPHTTHQASRTSPPPSSPPLTTLPFLHPAVLVNRARYRSH